MKAEDKRLAEAALKQMFVGRHLYGIHFFPHSPILRLEDTTNPASDRTTHLTIEAQWLACEDELPGNSAADMKFAKHTVEELAQIACSLREHSITSATLEDNVPHLRLRFDDGRLMLIDGHHDQFECWQASMGDFLIVAIPGDNVALWVPEDFHAA